MAEMAASTSLPDARARAARLLGAFEAAVRTRAEGSAEARAALEAAQRDCAILRRAVAIQAQRATEAAAAEAELRAQLSAQSAALQAAQMNAYSLGVHLRAALDGASGPGSGNPDIY